MAREPWARRWRRCVGQAAPPNTVPKTGSTAGQVAKGLNLNRGSVSTRLTQLAKSGEINKAARGYTA